MLRLGETVDGAPIEPQEISSDAAKMPPMSKSSLFVRNRGFIDKEGLLKSGNIVGAHKEVMWISQYLEVGQKVEMRQGY